MKETFLQLEEKQFQNTIVRFDDLLNRELDSKRKCFKIQNKN